MTQDYPDLQLTTGLEVIAGLLYVPLSAGGRDFIAFLRKGQPREVRWAGRPYKDGEARNVLEPRASFRLWSETVAGRCRLWSDEHLETAGVLALVYGKVSYLVSCLVRLCADLCVSSSSRSGDRRRPPCRRQNSLTYYCRMLVMKVRLCLYCSGRHVDSRLSTDAAQSYHKVRDPQFAVSVCSCASYIVIWSWLLMVHWTLKLARISASRMLRQK